MRLRPLTVLSIVSLAIALAMAGNVSAAERAIQPGSGFTVEVDLSFIQPLAYSWSSDVSLEFVIRDPSDVVVASVTAATSANDIYMAAVSGTHTLTWTNQNAVVAHLTFTLSGPFDEVTEGLSALMWGLVIVGVVIVGVVVIVVIVVVMGSRRSRPQQPMGPLPPMPPQAVASGRCPACGTVVDPNTSFCSRCGARFR